MTGKLKLQSLQKLRYLPDFASTFSYYSCREGSYIQLRLSGEGDYQTLAGAEQDRCRQPDLHKPKNCILLLYDCPAYNAFTQQHFKMWEDPLNYFQFF